MPKRTRSGSVIQSAPTYRRKKRYRKKSYYKYKKRKFNGGRKFSRKSGWNKAPQTRYKRTKNTQLGASLVPWLNPSGNLPRKMFVKMYSTHQSYGSVAQDIPHSRVFKNDIKLNSLLNPASPTSTEPLGITFLQPFFGKYQVMATKCKIMLMCPINNYPFQFQTRVGTAFPTAPTSWAEGVQFRNIKYTYVTNYTNNKPPVVIHKHYVKHNTYTDKDDDDPALQATLSGPLADPATKTYVEFAFQNPGQAFVGQVIYYNVMIRMTYYVKLFEPKSNIQTQTQVQAT